MSKDKPTGGPVRPFLNTAQAGHYLGLTARQLEYWRAQNIGPVFRRHGRYVVYHIDDLEAWSRSQSSAGPVDD